MSGLIRRKNGRNGKWRTGKKSRCRCDCPGKLLEQRPHIKDRIASRAIERALLQHFVPACVIVNHRGDIVYVHGRTGAYLEPSEGQPRNNVLEMEREGLQFVLAEAIRESATAGADVVRNGARISTDGVSNYVDLKVSDFDHPEALRELLLVLLPPADINRPIISRLRQTEEELYQTSEVFREGADPAIVLNIRNRITQLNDSGAIAMTAKPLGPGKPPA